MGRTTLVDLQFSPGVWHGIAEGHTHLPVEERLAIALKACDLYLARIDEMEKNTLVDQASVATWVRHNFPKDTPETVVLGLCEEAGELARASLKRFQEIRGTAEEWKQEIRKEVGDIYLKLAHVAEAYGFSLEEAITDRWNEISTRDWRSNPLGHGIPGE